MKKNASITLDVEVINKLKDLASKNERSFSQYVNLVLKAHIEEIEKKDIK